VAGGRPGAHVFRVCAGPASKAGVPNERYRALRVDALPHAASVFAHRKF